MQDCVSHEISRYYDAWKKKAVGITRDKNKADDLLHTVIARLLDRSDDEITQRACNGKLNAYVCRAMWLSITAIRVITTYCFANTNSVLMLVMWMTKKAMMYLMVRE